jgi:hypothetical protein
LEPDLLERAHQLHREAGDLMQFLKIKDVLQPFGEVVPTGSYYLDLMIYPGLEGGLFLNFRVATGDWGRPWKVDIWWLEPAMITQKMEIMLHFKEKLTPDLRLSILRYKNSLMTKDRRTPMYSGYYIYKAFLDEGLSDLFEVTRYLSSKGIILA